VLAAWPLPVNVVMAARVARSRGAWRLISCQEVPSQAKLMVVCPPFGGSTHGNRSTYAALNAQTMAPPLPLAMVSSIQFVAVDAGGGLRGALTVSAPVDDTFRMKVSPALRSGANAVAEMAEEETIR